MAKFDDFDLDIRKVHENVETERAVSLGCTTVTTAMTCGMPTICDTSIATMASCDGTCVGCTNSEQPCSANTCSACNSYCGGACRR